MGACEWGVESTTADSGGRITQRIVQGRIYNYSYTSQGQLAFYTDVEDPRRSATYTYDYADRRIAMTVGGGASGNASNPYAADYLLRTKLNPLCQGKPWTSYGGRRKGEV